MTELTTSASLPRDPLMPHLLDILPRPESEGLILGGASGCGSSRPCWRSRSGRAER